MPTVKVAFRGDQTQLSETARKAQASLEKLKGSASGVGSAFKMVAAGGIATALGSLAKQSILLASSMEQLEVAFSTMLGSGEKARLLLDEIRKLGASTPFEFMELATASKSLLAFGVDAKDITETLRMLGDVASGTGNPVGELAEIFGKAKVSGKIMAEDINQLTGRGIPVIQEFARQFGVTDGEVKKLVETGKVGFDNLKTALVSMTSEGGKFFNMMAAQSQTLQGQLSTLKDEFTAIGTIIGTETLPAIKDLTSATLGFIQAFQSGSLSDWLSEGTVGMAEDVWEATKKLGLKTYSPTHFLSALAEERQNREMSGKEWKPGDRTPASGRPRPASYESVIEMTPSNAPKSPQASAHSLEAAMQQSWRNFDAFVKAMKPAAPSEALAAKDPARRDDFSPQTTTRPESIISDMAKQGGASGVQGLFGGDGMKVQQEQLGELKQIRVALTKSREAAALPAWI